MRHFGTVRLLSTAMALLWGLSCTGAYAASPEYAVSFTPGTRFAAVDGDEDRFQSHQWVNQGMDGGLEEFRITSEDIGSDVTLWTEGRVLPGNHDYLLDLELDKEDFGFVHFEFQSFRKYYNTTGGVYPRYTQLPYVDAGRELHVDIGRVELEVGLTPPNLPDVTFGYEHEYKTGTKSRLTWASVTEAGAPLSSVKTAPSWQEVDEYVNAFEVRLHDDWGWIEWENENRWEHFRNPSTRYEYQVSANSTAADKKRREHILRPEADLFSSVIDLKKWFFKDRALLSGGYRYAQIENSETEVVKETNAAGVLTNFANPHQVLQSPSTNKYRTHTGVGSLFMLLTDSLNLGLKVKAEDVMHEGDSLLRNDTTGPDGNADRLDVSETNRDILRFGEGISLRYTGIPRFAFYNDVEFEQSDNDLGEDRQSPSAGELFNRFTETSTYSGNEVIGFNYYPIQQLTFTSQYRYHKDNIDYDDQSETAPTGSGAKSAFVDGQRTEIHEVSSRVATKFCDWFQPAFRYQFRDYGYTVRYENNPLDLRSDVFSHIYTLDVPVKPVPELLLNGSFQFQDSLVTTPAGEAGTFNYPKLEMDVWTFIASADYFINDRWSVNGAFQYQRADNYNDFTQTGLPYGTDYKEYDVSFGLKCKIREGVTLEPKYEYIQYDVNERVEVGDYKGHLVWVGVKIDWA